MYKTQRCKKSVSRCFFSFVLSSFSRDSKLRADIFLFWFIFTSSFFFFLFWTLISYPWKKSGATGRTGSSSTVRTNCFLLLRGKGIRWKKGEPRAWLGKIIKQKLLWKKERKGESGKLGKREKGEQTLSELPSSYRGAIVGQHEGQLKGPRGPNPPGTSDPTRVPTLPSPYLSARGSSARSSWRSRGDATSLRPGRTLGEGRNCHWDGLPRLEPLIVKIPGRYTEPQAPRRDLVKASSLIWRGSAKYAISAVPPQTNFISALREPLFPPLFPSSMLPWYFQLGLASNPIFHRVSSVTTI